MRRYTGITRIFFVLGSSLAILFICAYTGIWFWIDHDVKENIEIAKIKYPGRNAEDALLAYLSDTANSPQSRSQIAIWTLGQIRSAKAIPVLKELYKNDPEGKTCKGRHNIVLCQYEIYKALHAQEVNWWPLHPRRLQ